METTHSKYEYEYDDEQHMLSGKSSSGGGLLESLRRVVATAVAAVAVSGPLLVGMGVTLALTVSLAVVGLPVMLIFSPLLIFPCLILVTSVAGFSVAALLALAGITTLNWVFQSIRRQYQLHDGDGDVAAWKGAARAEEGVEEEAEDTAAKMLARGWKSEQEQQQQNQGQKQQSQEEQNQGQKQQSQQQQNQGQTQQEQQQNEGQKQQSQQEQNQGQQDQNQKPQQQQNQDQKQQSQQEQNQNQKQQQQNQGQKQHKETVGEEGGEGGKEVECGSGVRSSATASAEDTSGKGDTEEGKSEKQQEEEDVTEEAKSAADASEKKKPLQKSQKPATKPKK